jgi:hypothetical protein
MDGHGRQMKIETTASRVAANQHAFRQANARIADGGDHIADGEFFPLLCECPETGCVEIARLTRSEYEAVRADGRTFFVVPGHEITAVEGVEVSQVLEKFDRYSVMEKIGEAGAIAEQLDSTGGE